MLVLPQGLWHTSLKNFIHTYKLWIHYPWSQIMHQSFVVPAPTGPGNSRAFNFSVFKALLNALQCGDKFMVKIPAKSPRPPEADNNEEQQKTWTPSWTIWITFYPYSMEVPHEIWLQLAQWFQRRYLKIHTHTYTHTHTHTHNTHTQNLGSSEKLSPGKYTVLYPIKTPAISPGYFSGKLKPQHIFGIAETHWRLNPGT